MPTPSPIPGILAVFHREETRLKRKLELQEARISETKQDLASIQDLIAAQPV